MYVEPSKAEEEHQKQHPTTSVYRPFSYIFWASLESWDIRVEQQKQNQTVCKKGVFSFDFGVQYSLQEKQFLLGQKQRKNKEQQDCKDSDGSLPIAELNIEN